MKIFYPYPKRGRIDHVNHGMDAHVVFVYFDFEFFWAQVAIAALLDLCWYYGAVRRPGDEYYGSTDDWTIRL